MSKEPQNNLKGPATSKKRPEMIFNKQKTTWSNLQWARNDLKQPSMNKKQPEMTYSEQETTWNDLQQARNNLKWSTKSKIYLKQSKLTYNEQKNYKDINK